MPTAYFPEDLLTSIREQRVHLFIGSGVSIAAHLAGWDEIVEKMKYSIRKENRDFTPAELNQFLKKSDMLDVADVFRKTVHDHAYYKFLRKHYRQDVKPSTLHKAIARLPVRTIFTTNYDKLLEVA